MSKKRKRKRTRLVVIYDANMPPFTDCWSGCTARGHLCSEAYPKGVVAIDHKQRLEGIPDYLVLRYAMRQLKAIRGVSSDTRIFLFTRDRTFWGSAKHQWESRRRRARDIHFPEYRKVDVWLQHDRSLFTEPLHRRRIEIAYIESPSRKKRDIMGESIRTVEEILAGRR